MIPVIPVIHVLSTARTLANPVCVQAVARAGAVLYNHDFERDGFLPVPAEYPARGPDLCFGVNVLVEGGIIGFFPTAGKTTRPASF